MAIARLNRRMLLGSTALASCPSLVLGVRRSNSKAAENAIAPPVVGQDQATPVGEVKQVGPPDWKFAIIELQDPYSGKMQQPAERAAGTRVVAALASIDNASDQALNFFIGDVRLRDVAGTEYRAGSAWGAEPRLSSRNLNTGERARGWVWFVVPVDTELEELVYLAPSPELRIGLTGG